MSAPGEVEFFTDNGSVLASDEDAVEFGEARMPYWALIVGCVLAAAVFIGAAASRSDPKHVATPIEAPTTSAAVAGLFGPPVDLAGGSHDAVNALIQGKKLYVLRTSGLSVVDLATKAVATIGWPAGYSIGDETSTRLLLDSDTDRLWVLGIAADSTRLLEVSTERMVPISHLTVHAVVHDATVMDGHVYLATSVGLWDVAPSETAPTLLPVWRSPLSGVAADPTRHRVLVVADTVPTVAAVAVSQVPNDSARQYLGALINSSIAIVRGEIWVGGSSPGRPGVGEITRLDPATLATVQTSSVALEVTRVVVTAGDKDVWVSTGAPGLWCLDVGGNILERWSTGGAPVTSGPGGAFFIRDGTVVPLRLNGCPG